MLKFWFFHGQCHTITKLPYKKCLVCFSLHTSFCKIKRYKKVSQPPNLLANIRIAHYCMNTTYNHLCILLVVFWEHILLNDSNEFRPEFSFGRCSGRKYQLLRSTRGKEEQALLSAQEIIKTFENNAGYILMLLCHQPNLRWTCAEPACPQELKELSFDSTLRFLLSQSLYSKPSCFAHSKLVIKVSYRQHLIKKVEHGKYITRAWYCSIKF